MLFSHSHTQSSFYFCKSHKHVSNWPDHKIYTYYVFSYTCIIFTLPIILLYFSNYCYLSFNNEHFSQEVWAIFFLLTFFSNRTGVIPSKWEVTPWHYQIIGQEKSLEISSGGQSILPYHCEIYISLKDNYLSCYSQVRHQIYLYIKHWTEFFRG